MNKEEEIEGLTYYPEFVYSWANRVLHWIRAAVITALAITGFYIADPFLAPSNHDDLVFAQWAAWHNIFGAILISAGVLRIYLFFFGKGHENELRSFQDVISLKSWVTQLKSYFFVGELKKKGIYGPLQFVTYIVIMLLVIVASLTGLMLYANVYHLGFGALIAEPMAVLTSWCGGLANVRLIHHITMWGFLIFIPIHIYLVIWSAIRHKHGALDVMFTGYDYHLKKSSKNRS